MFHLQRKQRGGGGGGGETKTWNLETDNSGRDVTVARLNKSSSNAFLG